MRNLFDQYTQPENRLTHALAVCLNEDRQLLKSFLRWLHIEVTGIRPAAMAICEQSLPGDPPRTEDQSDRGGLPDIVIHDDDCWCVLIESKVMAKLTGDQLHRHKRTLQRRGFSKIIRVALTRDGKRVDRSTITVTWSSLYEWLGLAGQRGPWAARLRDYLRAAEVRLTQEAHLTEGTLTRFDGFPFSDKNPYTYGEAKRLLKLAMGELKADRSLRALGADPKASGRPAITGRGGRVVWDFLPLTDRPKRGAFTAYPHLTLGLHADHLEVALTIPNGVIRPVRQRMCQLGVEGFAEVNRQILRRARPLLKRGAVIEAWAQQRHYVSQRSKGQTDAVLSFRLETGLDRGQDRVRPQPEWLQLFAALPRRKRANIQFQYRVQMEWKIRGLDSRESLKLIASSWCALEPLLMALRPDSKTR